MMNSVMNSQCYPSQQTQVQGQEFNPSNLLTLGLFPFLFSFSFFFEDSFKAPKEQIIINEI